MNGEENLSNKLLNKVEDFFVPIKTRLSNSWVASFAIAWVIINWQPILYVILAKEPILERFIYIEKTYYNSLGANWWFYFFLPLLIGAFYAFVFPFIEPGMEWATLFQRRLTNDRNHELLMNDLVNQEKLALKKAKVNKIEELQEKIEDREKEITALKLDIIDVRKEKELESGKLTKTLKELAESNTDKSRIANELSTQNLKLENAKNQINTNIGQINNLNNELDSLRKQYNKEAKDNNERKIQIEELALEIGRLKGSEEQLIKLTDDYNNTLKNLSEKEQAIEAFNRDIKGLEKSKKQLELTNEEQSKKIIQLENEKSISDHDKIILEGNSKFLEEQLESYKSQLEQYEPIYSNKNILVADLENIQEKIPVLTPQTFNINDNNRDFLQKTISLISELSNAVEHPIGNSPNYKIDLFVLREMNYAGVVEMVLSVAAELNIRVLNIVQSSQNIVELYIYATNVMQIHSFIGRGDGYWVSGDSKYITL